jgi:hypothetical protein
MNRKKGFRDIRVILLYCCLIFLGSLLVNTSTVEAAFTVNVVDGDGIPITVGYRWLLEEDNTNVAVPGKPVSDSISLSIHKSHAPVLKAGRSDAASTTIDAKVSKKTRYFVSVLPDSGYAMGGAVVEAKQGNVTITVQKFPIPTAQISILAFVDQGPINNAFDEGEQGLGGCTIKVEDGTVGGPISQDAFGNPLGTVYALDAGGNPIPDPATGYQILTRGTGVLTTLTKTEFDTGQNPYNLIWNYPCAPNT